MSRSKDVYPTDGDIGLEWRPPRIFGSYLCCIDDSGVNGAWQECLAGEGLEDEEDKEDKEWWSDLLDEPLDISRTATVGFGISLMAFGMFRYSFLAWSACLHAVCSNSIQNDVRAVSLRLDPHPTQQPLGPSLYKDKLQLSAS